MYSADARGGKQNGKIYHGIGSGNDELPLYSVTTAKAIWSVSRRRNLRRSIRGQGGSEHDAMEIWSTQMGVAQEALLKINGTHENIGSHRHYQSTETTVVWDKKPAFRSATRLWQCRRTAEYCDELKAAGYSDMIREDRTSDRCLFQRHEAALDSRKYPGARQKAEAGRLLFGTIETWLIWKLTDGKGACDRLFQRFPHDDVQYQYAGVGR